MSSIYINSQLHRSWKEAVKGQARGAMEKIHPITSLRPAPRPSTSEPPPEQFGDVIRALTPFLNHGVNASVFSAIAAACGASVGASPASLYPAQYLGGATASTDGLLLRWPHDWVGLPLVLEEEFPISSLFPNPDDAPPAATPFPAGALGQVVLTGYSGAMMWPRLVSNAPIDNEAETLTVHPREVARMVSAGLPGLAMKTFTSNFRYTGCVRPASEEEIETLFRDIIRPECCFTLNFQSIRDMFSLTGIDLNIFERAFLELERMSRATGAAPTPPAATNVQGRPRRNRDTIVADDLEISSSTRVLRPRGFRSSPLVQENPAPAPQPPAAVHTHSVPASPPQGDLVVNSPDGQPMVYANGEWRPIAFSYASMPEAASGAATTNVSASIPVPEPRPAEINWAGLRYYNQPAHTPEDGN